MDIVFVYSTIPKSEINDDLIIVCSHLFNTNYGKWSPLGYKPGENVKMGIKTMKENMLFNDQCGIVIAKLHNEIVGYCFYSKFIDIQIGKNCWITQLVVVDKNKRHQGIAKNVIHKAFDIDCNVCGLVSSHPYAIRSLEKATGYLCEPNIIELIIPNLLNNNPIPYIQNKIVTKTIINTEFFVDHTNILNIIEDDDKWILGNLPEGYEFFAFIIKKFRIKNN